MGAVMWNEFFIHSTVYYTLHLNWMLNISGYTTIWHSNIAGNLMFELNRKTGSHLFWNDGMQCARTVRYYLILNSLNNKVYYFCNTHSLSFLGHIASNAIAQIVTTWAETSFERKEKSYRNSQVYHATVCLGNLLCIKHKCSLRSIVPINLIMAQPS